MRLCHCLLLHRRLLVLLKLLLLLLVLLLLKLLKLLLLVLVLLLVLWVGLLWLHRTLLTGTAKLCSVWLHHLLRSAAACPRLC